MVINDYKSKLMEKIFKGRIFITKNYNKKLHSFDHIEVKVTDNIYIQNFTNLYKETVKIFFSKF